MCLLVLSYYSGIGVLLKRPSNPITPVVLMDDVATGDREAQVSVQSSTRLVRTEATNLVHITPVL